MNVTVEQLGPCKRLLRVEVDPQAVDRAFSEVTASFQRQASLPGFRPGKAPLHLIGKSFAPRIEEETKKKLINDAYQQALKDQNLRPVVYPDIEEIQFGRGQSLQFAVTVEIFPDFEVPPYCGIEVTREVGQVTDSDVDRALQILREQRASYNDVDRAVQPGDYVVANYTGTTDGKPISDLSPSLKGLSERENFWMHVDPANKFIPGLTEQLLGAVAGETRVAKVTFPSDFAATILANKEAEYSIQVLKVKERILPELTDEFSTQLGAKNLDHLREGVATDLQQELSFKQKRGVRDQIVKFLTSRVQFELPETVVTNETRNVVYDIVQENQQRGVTKEAIDQNKEAIYSAANASAKDRVKVGFILGKIAELEKIKASEQEIMQRIYALSQQHQIKPDKLIKQLQERNAIMEIAEQITTGKVMDFLELHAKITDVVASTATTPAPTASDAPAAS